MELFQMKRFWDEGDEETKNLSGLEKLNERIAKKRKLAEKSEDEKEDDDEEGKDPHGDEEKVSVKQKAKSGEGEDLPEDSGFTVLGEDNKKKRMKKKVKRILPRWLTEPNLIEVDLKDDQMSVENVPGLCPSMVEKLIKNGVKYLFPVQRQIVPHLLDSSMKNYYRPSDVCVSAPTGSGKTLAFVLPIVQALQNRVVPKIRALVVLPVQELAIQVFKVFSSYCEGEDLKVKLLISGSKKNFKDEQKELVRKGIHGHYHSLADIIVATPGRLVDHLQYTAGFSLEALRYLIIDEADRVMQEIQNDWLSQVEDAVYSGNRRKRPGVLNVDSANVRAVPLQKLLFSATLSQNPEKLQELSLYEPKLFCSVVRPEDIVQRKENVSGTYETPQELTEKSVPFQSLMKKPAILLKLLDIHNIESALVFTKSVDNAHFLSVLLKQCGLSVGELSSRIEQNRNKVLNKFKSKKFQYLICTDALSRGIDIGTVDYVISYDCPKFVKTYIHRVGRTARAGRQGTAFTLVHEGSEKKSFHYIIEQTSKNIDDISKVIINEEQDLDLESYESAREKASLELLEEKKKLNQKKYVRIEKRNVKKRKVKPVSNEEK